MVVIACLRIKDPPDIFMDREKLCRAACRIPDGQRLQSALVTDCYRSKIWAKCADPRAGAPSEQSLLLHSPTRAGGQNPEQQAFVLDSQGTCLRLQVIEFLRQWKSTVFVAAPGSVEDDDFQSRWDLEQCCLTFFNDSDASQLSPRVRVWPLQASLRELVQAAKLPRCDGLALQARI